MVMEEFSMFQIFWMLRFVTHLWAGWGCMAQVRDTF